MVEPTEPRIQRGRSVETICRSVFEPRHYRAMKNILLHHSNPIEFTLRYAFASGTYPCSQKIRFKGREINLCAYSWHDVLTINEIFFRNDYLVSGDETVIVDFGSNIGISAAFFLLAAEKSYCYLFEPVPTNCSRLKQNLAGFERRYEFQEAAVALNDGEETFGVEKTGRYGGIGIKTGSYMTVPCLDAIRVLREIINRHGPIDILKIDIEALEKEILGAIPEALLANIRKIYVEQSFETNPLARTHSYVQIGSVAQFFLRRSPSAAVA
jgi:FkbM family methyltransferase